jgi:hypothetical protein
MRAHAYIDVCMSQDSSPQRECRLRMPHASGHTLQQDHHHHLSIISIIISIIIIPMLPPFEPESLPLTRLRTFDVI